MKNIYKATPEEQRDWLFSIIDNELSKPDSDADIALIQECTELAGELLSPRDRHSEAELSRKLKKIMGAANISKRRIPLYVKIASAAAALLLLCSAFIAVRLISRANDMVLIKDGSEERFDSIESLIVTIDKNIMYPAALPEGTALKNAVLKERDQEYVLRFETGPGDTVISVKNYYDSSITNSEGYRAAGKKGRAATTGYLTGISPLTELERAVIDGKYSYLIFEGYGENCSAVCQYAGFEYVITAPDRASLFLIIENMRMIGES